MLKTFKNFKEFYPFYLSQHSNKVNRVLHRIGTCIGVVSVLWIIWHEEWKYLWLPVVLGYAFAWVGHFFFEKNKPATFQYPLYSFRADFVMLFEIFKGK